MVICPCSSGTAAAIAHGLSQNLIHRAADVHLKEKRKLVLVPREAPLSVVQLRNLTICAEVGAVVLPAAPGFYTKPQSLGRCDQFHRGACLRPVRRRASTVSALGREKAVSRRLGDYPELQAIRATASRALPLCWVRA